MNIEGRVKDILHKLSGVEILENSVLLQEELALDSISMVMMLIEIEEEFKIELNESDMNPFDFSTVQNIIDLVSKYCGDSNG